MLDDATFGQIARGDLNPGRELLPPALADRACDTADMRDNLWLLYALTMGLSRPTPDSRKPVRVLEIGVSDGTSTLAFLKAVHDSDGHVTSIDVSEVPVAAALIGKFRLQERWTFIHADSANVLPGLSSEGLYYDLILVDGDHTYERALLDVKFALRLLTPGGILLLHDSHLMAVDHDWNKPHGQRGTPGCGRVASRIFEEGMNGLEGLVLPFGYNLSVLRRRKDNLEQLREPLREARIKGLLP